MVIPRSKNGQDTCLEIRHDARMDRTNFARMDGLVPLVEWIEQHLAEPLTLDQVANQAGLSPHHFSRLFTARMGRSVMAYVRARRLIRAAHRLVDEAGVPLIELAFDCGFDSQEAFTRAFRRLFGVTPGRFRQGFCVTPIEGQYPMTLSDPSPAPVVQLPGLVPMPAFSVAGCSRRFDEANKAEIPQLWAQLMGALPFDGQSPGWTTYGVVWGADRAEGSFEYMAAVEITPGSIPPAGLVTRNIPAATYAIFRITLNGGAPHPQVKAAMAMIWGQLIPGAGLKLADSPDFERYDGEFAPNRPGAIIDFHVPVEA